MGRSITGPSPKDELQEIPAKARFAQISQVLGDRTLALSLAQAEIQSLIQELARLRGIILEEQANSEA